MTAKKPNVTSLLVDLQNAAISLTKKGLSKQHLAAILAHESSIPFAQVMTVLKHLEQMGKAKTSPFTSAKPFTVIELLRNGEPATPANKKKAEKAKKKSAKDLDDAFLDGPI